MKTIFIYLLGQVFVYSSIAIIRQPSTSLLRFISTQTHKQTHIQKNRYTDQSTTINNPNHKLILHSLVKLHRSVTNSIWNKNVTETKKKHLIIQRIPTKKQIDHGIRNVDYKTQTEDNITTPLSTSATTTLSTWMGGMGLLYYQQVSLYRVNKW